MGIKGLDTLLKQKCSKNAIKPACLRDIYGKVVCVDMSELIYKSIRKHKNAYVSGVLNLIELLSNWNIKPIIVFDGKSDPAKNNVNKTRTMKREKAQKHHLALTQQLDVANEMVLTLDMDIEKEMEQTSISSMASSTSSSPIFDTDISRSSSSVSLTSFDNLDLDNINTVFNPDDKNSIKEQLQTIKEKLEDAVDKAENKTQTICYKKISEIKELLDQFGIPYIHDKRYEADIICSHLVKNNIADYCISNDMDMLAFGCNKVIRNLSFTSDLIDIYFIDNILLDLNITQPQFIDMCILLGCDYTTKLINIKSSMPLNLITKYNNIENVITNLTDINATLEKHILYNDNFKYYIARNIFNIELAPDIWTDIITSIDLSKIDKYKSVLNTNITKYEELFEYCINTCSTLNDELITNKINAFIGNTHAHYNSKYYTSSYKKYNNKYKSDKYNANHIKHINYDIKRKLNYHNKTNDKLYKAPWQTVSL
jgi:5'-3' exonuclease